MAKYKEYNTQSGTRWSARGYLGVNEATGKQEEFNKRGFKTKKEAQVAFARAKNSFFDGDYITSRSKSITFNEVYQEWLSMYVNDVRESTYQKTMTIFRVNILPIIGHKLMDKITKNDLQKAVNQWHDKMATYKKVFNYTKNIFDYAIKNEYIKKNPCLLVTIPKKTKVKVEKTTADFYTRSELEALFNILSQEQSYKWQAVFRLLAFTGLRRGEVLALTWKDINFKQGSLNVNKTLTVDKDGQPTINPPKTSAGLRVISMDQITMDILKAWKNEQAELLIGFGFNAINSKQLLFSQLETNDFLHLTAIRNKLDRVCKQNNFKMINVHGFRHTHCSLLFEAGVPLKDVKERLGHEDISTTMNIYTHVTQDSKDKSAELFAKYVNF